ncbi:uncharacterized protein PV09_02962 [Verruconis gallopava]|uniref:Uncharacterized protein n=1 Tax=Verruconis gallopava TaxID=253628 RepID=A0A0D2AJ36_9PEZI|nr:uncharacterized protein PV09_02962 [Verruconis gallopava]KIW06530.1 hypothetical protein PV09_02962 [Verruconis gallopava]
MTAADAVAEDTLVAPCSADAPTITQPPEETENISLTGCGTCVISPPTILCEACCTWCHNCGRAIRSAASNHLDNVRDSIYRRPLASPRSEPDVETKRNLGAVLGVGIEHFLGDNSDDKVPLSLSQKLKDLCLPAVLAEVQYRSNPTSKAVVSRRAWLDDRYISPKEQECCRKYCNPLSACDLYEHLKDSNVQRRLLYIEDLDAYYLSSLIQTVVDYHTCPLKDAFESHFEFRTKLCLEHKPEHPEYRISMHMNFPVTVPEAFKVDHSKLHNWKDTSFANKQRRASKRNPISGIYTARKTIEICGKGFENYTVWAFFDVLHDRERIEEKNEDDFPYETSNGLIHEDQIVFKNKLDANKPFFDVRPYALRILDCVVQESVFRWKDAIQPFKDPFTVHEQRINNISTQSRESGQRFHHNVEEAYDQTHRWIHLFMNLEVELSGLVGKLEKFLALDGNLKFFSDPSFAHADRTSLRIRRIENGLDDLKEIHCTLKGHLQSCNRYKDKLDHTLKLEAEKRSAKTAQTTMMTVYIVTPIMVGIGICSMNENLIPVSLHKVSLVVVFLGVFIAFYFLQFFLSVMNDVSKWCGYVTRAIGAGLVASCKSIQRYVQDIQGRTWARPDPDIAENA